MATYADLYDEPDAGPPEGELVAAPSGAPPARPRRWWERLIPRGRAMNVVALILELGRWGQTHQYGDALRGSWACRWPLGVTSLVLRGRRAGP